ncbi:DedA family protein [uncultured Porphyromonas sp.]|uniref:DedA family protein n=1 Tax=uncultured Porphyromonas sp. TaxID=159274 RepID=UPI00260B3D6A|nr:DedA family protein [uncultured Porphyromonas sp.]
MLEQLTLWFFEHLNYWTVFLLMTIESSFIPFPSEVVVPPAAFLAATDGQMSVVGVLFFATSGAIVGALINYYLAMWLGRPIVYRFAGSRVGRMLLLSPEKLDRANEYFVRKGAVSTFVGRLVPGIRQLISIPAGLARMPLGAFVGYTALGAGVWNAILTLIGVLLSRVPGIETKEQVVAKASEYSQIIGYSILAIVLLLLTIYIVKQVRRKRRRNLITD